MSENPNNHVRDADDIIARHERLLEQSRHMLELARLGQWDALVEEESRYIIAVEELMLREPPAGLPEVVQHRRAALLEQVLEHSAEIQRHLLARRDELSQLIADSRRKQDLDRAYGSTLGAEQLKP